MRPRDVSLLLPIQRPQKLKENHKLNKNRVNTFPISWGKEARRDIRKVQSLGSYQESRAASRGILDGLGKRKVTGLWGWRTQEGRWEHWGQFSLASAFYLGPCFEDGGKLSVGRGSIKVLCSGNPSISLKMLQVCKILPSSQKPPKRSLNSSVSASKWHLSDCFVHLEAAWNSLQTIWLGDWLGKYDSHNCL